MFVPTIDVGLARISELIRLFGAGWIIVLTVIHVAFNMLDRPAITVAFTVASVLWAVGLRATALLRNPAFLLAQKGTRIAIADLIITLIVMVGPAFFGENANVVGGYPFASLVVCLAVLGKRGLTVAALAIGGAVLGRLLALGLPITPGVSSTLFIYLLGAVLLGVGHDASRKNERRALEAESALAKAEERGAMAVHLHDSVLQTLALIQRRATEPDTVRALARSQETELRDWLFPPATTPTAVSPNPHSTAPNPDADQTAHTTNNEQTSTSPPAATLRSALEQHAHQLQEHHGVHARIITVGDVAKLNASDTNPPIAAISKAAREAMLNAAVHSGETTIDVFAETVGNEVAVFIRDRGAGFDPTTVDSRRQGVRRSITERMERHGGSATIKSSVGAGTEVELRVPQPTTP